MFEISIHEIA